MATPGELVHDIALTLGVPEKTVTVHDRNLVMAGLRTKGGRGNSAAKMTSQDAANLLISVTASDQVKNSVDAVRRFASIFSFKSRRKPYPKLVPELSDLKPGHSFMQALAAVIEATANGSFERLLKTRGLSLSSLDIDITIELPIADATIAIRSGGPLKLESYRSADFWDRLGATPAWEQTKVIRVRTPVIIGIAKTLTASM